jgi:hypothetical protein
MAQRESGIAKWNAKVKHTERHGERQKVQGTRFKVKGKRQKIKGKKRKAKD